LPSKFKSRLLILSWALYDLANQFFALNVITVYFPRWLTLEKQAPEIFYSLAFGFSMVVVGALAPLLGTISDFQQKKKIYLIHFTLLSVFFTALLGFSQNIILALIFFALANIGCQISVVFYNALIVNVSRDDQIGLVSGIGRMFAYCGAILALFLSKPIILNYGYSTTFIMTGIIFLLFSLPAMIFIKEEKPLEEKPLRSFLTKQRFLEIFHKVKSAFSPHTQFQYIRRFLIAFFFGLCALQTMILFMAVYAGAVFNLDESGIIDLIIFSTLFAIAGSFISGIICDRIGNRKAMMGVFLLWMIVFILGAFCQAPFHWVVGAIIGFALSSTWVIARAWAVQLVPKKNLGEIFGLFNFVGYLAGIVGPLYWGLMRLVLAPLGAWGYRLSLLGLLIFVFLAFYHLLKIPKE